MPASSCATGWSSDCREEEPDQTSSWSPRRRIRERRASSARSRPPQDPLRDREWDWGGEAGTVANRLGLPRRAGQALCSAQAGKYRRWMDERTPFPQAHGDRLSLRALRPPIRRCTTRCFSLPRNSWHRASGSENQKRFRYWSALGLLRGMMSSPQRRCLMLENRAAAMQDPAGAEDSDEAIPTSSGSSRRTTNCRHPCWNETDWSAERPCRLRGFS